MDVGQQHLFALGRTLTVAAMMGSQLKVKKQLQFVLTKQAHRINHYDADSKGIVRGYVTNPEVHFQYNSGKLNVGMLEQMDNYQ